MKTPEIISNQAALDARCAEWRALGWFAFDTEFIRDDTYDANLCLMQVQAEGDAVLIDPAEVDVAPFWELVADPAVRTIVHAGKEDFDLCLRATGKPPRNIFDVQIAAGFVGYGYPLSLQRLVQAVLRRRVSKGQTLTDWSLRPLTPEQLHYAIEDVAYLPGVCRKIERRLQERQRVDWAAEEFARLEDPALYRPTTQDRLQKLRGTGKLDGLGLAVLSRLLTWREEWARARNRPTRAMMRDDILIEIARRRPKQARDLEVLRGFPQARNPKVIQEILELTRAAEAAPPESWPQPQVQREDPPMMRAVLDLISAFTRAVCLDEEVDPDLVGSTQRFREVLEHLAGEREAIPVLLGGWRAEFIGNRLIELLKGVSAIRLAGWPRDLRLTILPADGPARG